MGSLRFDDMPAVLRDILALARFTHLGQHSAFGFGRFSLEGIAPDGPAA